MPLPARGPPAPQRCPGAARPQCDPRLTALPAALLQGSCLAAAAIRNATLLTSWGNWAEQPWSTTTYAGDNWSDGETERCARETFDENFSAMAGPARVCQDCRACAGPPQRQ